MIRCCIPPRISVTDAQCPITFAVDVSGQNQLRVEFSLTKDDNWSEPVLLIKGLTLYQ